MLSFIVEFFPFSGHNIPREVNRMSSKLSLSATYDWKPVLTSAGKEFEYPGSLGTNLRGEYSHPALYRWRIQDSGKLVAVAISETDNLARTAALFNEPSAPQAINRLKSVLSEHVFRGNEIHLDLIALASFEIGGKSLGAQSLRDSDIRKLLETLLLHDAKQSGIRLLSTAQEKPTLPF